MRRRAFIAFGGAAAVAWPLAARAQQPAMPLIGFLDAQSLEARADRLRAFRQGLNNSGYVEGDNVTIVYRFAENQPERLPALAAELIRRQVGVIVAPSGTSALAAQAVTTTIPIVFATGDDPVRLGLVASLARPGGNSTGINFFSGELAAKKLELLRVLVPTAGRIVVLVDPAAAATETVLRDTEAAGRAMGVQIHAFNVSTSGEINAVFASFVRERPDALLVSGGVILNSRRAQLVNLASYHRVPAIFPNREPTQIGGLMSYGSDPDDAWRQAGAYAGRILKGTKPADLPVVQATKFELIINSETARMLGLTIPASLLATATEVIE
jgi:putative ABC transport system substrate-binding protein